MSCIFFTLSTKNIVLKNNYQFIQPDGIKKYDVFVCIIEEKLANRKRSRMFIVLKFNVWKEKYMCLVFYRTRNNFKSIDYLSIYVVYDKQIHTKVFTVKNKERPNKKKNAMFKDSNIKLSKFRKAICSHYTSQRYNFIFKNFALFNKKFTKNAIKYIRLPFFDIYHVLLYN